MRPSTRRILHVSLRIETPNVIHRGAGECTSAIHPSSSLTVKYSTASKRSNYEVPYAKMRLKLNLSKSGIYVTQGMMRADERVREERVTWRGQSLRLMTSSIKVISFPIEESMSPKNWPPLSHISQATDSHKIPPPPPPPPPLCSLRIESPSEEGRGENAPRERRKGTPMTRKRCH